MAVALNSPNHELEPTRLSSVLQKLKEFALSPRWLAAIMILVIWQLIAMKMNTRVIPYPEKVLSIMWDALITGEFFHHLAASLTRILTGFGLMLPLGTVVGIIMGSRRSWEPLFKDLVILGLTMPGLIYALLAVMFFGLSLMAPIVAVVGACYPFVAVNIREGVRALDKDLLDMGKAYHIKRSKVITKIILPFLLPFFLAAIRTSFAIAWKISTLVEVFGAENGVGYMIRAGFDAFSVADIVAWALLFGGVMLAIEYGILAPAERYLARWRPNKGKVL